MLLDNHHGVDRRVEMEAGILREAAIDVRVVAWDRRPGASSAPVRRTGTSGEEIVRIGAPAVPGGGLQAVRACARFCAEAWRRRTPLARDADLVVAHDLYLLPLGVAFARRFRVPLVYDAHEDFAALEHGRHPAAVVRAMGAVERVLGALASAVVVPSPLRRPRWDGCRPEVVTLRNIGARRAPMGCAAPRWDIAAVGMLSEERRVDLLLDLARVEPSLRIAIAGRGRLEHVVARAAAELPNVEYLGWVEDPDEVLAAGRAIYYGQDPEHAYAQVACPNTLYQAVRVRRPLLYFCDGEVEDMDRRHRLGVRCAPTVAGLVAGFRRVVAGEDFGFARAAAELERAPDAAAYAATMQRLIAQARGVR